MGDDLVPVILLLPFSIFGICCLLQFHFGDRVLRSLKARHEAVYLKINGALVVSKLTWFALTRADSALADAELTRRTKRFRVLALVAIGAWLSFLILAMILA